MTYEVISVFDNKYTQVTILYINYVKCMRVRHIQIYFWEMHIHIVKYMQIKGNFDT